MEVEPINITEIIITIISLIGTIITSVINYKITQNRQRGEGEPTKEKIEPKNKKWLIAMYVFIILLTANLGLLGWKYWGSKPPTEVEITYPNDGSIVEIKEIIKGTSQRVTKEHTIWVVVYSHAVDRYYPQSNPAEVQANGKWFSSSYIGIEEDVDKKFDIIAVVVNKEAQDVFNAYLTQAEREKTYTGFEKLPDVSTIYDRIEVTRNSLDIKDTYIRGFDLLISGKIDEAEEAFRSVYDRYETYKSAEEILSLFKVARRDYEKSEEIKMYILKTIIEEELVVPSRQQYDEILRIIGKK